jgi:isopentenyl diphosphate isomerase/L-lactate dehydrogenase-like FMN-dependent dehydrogenase
LSRDAVITARIVGRSNTPLTLITSSLDHLIALSFAHTHMKSHELNARRRLLQFMLASPLLAGAATALAEAGDPLIEKIDEALNVFDFEAVAKRNLPPAHWGYLATGVDDEATIKANRDGFTKFALRARRMVDVSKVDMGLELFGMRYDSPIFLCPVSSQRAFHAEGEVGAAKAAKAGKHLQLLSTLTSYPVEDVLAARGGEGLWYQLYPTDQFEVTTQVLKRVHGAGVPAVAITVDLNGGSNRETAARLRRADKRDCTACHESPRGGTRLALKPMFNGIDVSKVRSTIPNNISWDYVKRVREVYPGKLLLKGIVTKEDGALAVRHGLDGVVVSNHGGRAEESGRGTIESLSEVIDGTRRKIPVLIDSGFRRGTDIFKALALGATAVGVGRPYVWGLAAYGQAGAESVLRILRDELRTSMQQAGTRSLAEISSASLVKR